MNHTDQAPPRTPQLLKINSWRVLPLPWPDPLNDELADDFNRWYPGFTQYRHPFVDTTTSANATTTAATSRQGITFEIH